MVYSLLGEKLAKYYQLNNDLTPLFRWYKKIWKTNLQNIRRTIKISSDNW